MYRLSIALTALFVTAAPAIGQTAPPRDNAEMAAIFAADQAVREHVTPEQLRDSSFVRNMIAADDTRRARTRVLLDTGKLTTGEDYHAAAFVFQHGSRPEEYLLAHSLALAAVARGKADASWIATATLDRYLEAIGQKQIYGTQYMRKGDEPMTQEPYDRTLIPDSLRTALGVPVQAAQAARLATMRAATPAAK